MGFGRGLFTETPLAVFGGWQRQGREGRRDRLPSDSYAYACSTLPLTTGQVRSQSWLKSCAQVRGAKDGGHRVAQVVATDGSGNRVVTSTAYGAAVQVLSLLSRRFGDAHA